MVHSLHASHIFHSPSREMGQPITKFSATERKDKICNLSYSPHLLVETKKGRVNKVVHQSPRKKMSRNSSTVHWLCPQCCFHGFPEEVGEVLIQSTKDLLSASLFFSFYFGHGTSDKAVFVGKTSRGTPVDQ